MEGVRSLRRRGQRRGLIECASYVFDNIEVNKMAEIGCYAGESAMIFHDVLDGVEIYAIDPWSDGKEYNKTMRGHNIFENVEKVFDERTKGANITKMKMTSEVAFKEFDDASLDFVYIDAVHTYESVKNNIEIWLPKIKKGGYIGGHDYPRKPITKAIIEVLGEPEITFQDTSWLVRVK